MADTGLDCLQKISDYLRRNFPDFFAEARFAGFIYMTPVRENKP